MTSAEIRAHNAGVLAVLLIAKRSAEAIAATSTRHVHEDFAVAALAKLVESGREMFEAVPKADASHG